MRVLLTNDDGVASAGLLALLDALRDAGHDVLVVAPDRDHSGCGGAIGPLHLSGKILFERVTTSDGHPMIAVDGPPALCVTAACLGGFGPPPDVVVSGVNPGANTGRAVLHSGTVGAALTAVNLGRAAVAVSIQSGGALYWRTACDVATSLVPWLGRQKAPAALNVNVPNRPGHEVRGVYAGLLAEVGIVQAAVAETDDGVLELTLPADLPAQPGTDTALVRDGCVSVTPLVGISEAAGGGFLDTLELTADSLRRTLQPS